MRKYGYKYDDMNRLRDAVYQREGQERQSYNEGMDYDKNGNILHLNRNGALDAQNAVIEIDRLDYSYEDAASPNRLTKVFDRSAHPLGFKDDSDGITDSNNDYSYDGFGNLKEDQNKKISRITYNHLNLPLEIVFDSGKINYLYDANGTKLRKTVTAGTAVTVTDYANGYQYLNDVLQFFPTAEGYVKNTVGSGGNSFDYAYIYKDHLGNNRLTYGVDRATGVMKIMEENHYYPFGLKHGSYNTGLNDFQRQESAVVLKAPVNPNPGDGDVLANSFKYRYNGKEFQEELGLNMYDMDMRQYDPAIGRWVVQDPIVHHDFSPYNAFDNNPVFWADPSGADSQTGQTDSNGSNRFDALGQYIPPLDRFVKNYPFDNSDEDRYKRNVSKNYSDSAKETDPPKKNNTLIGGAYNGIEFSSISDVKTLIDYLSLTNIDIYKTSITHDQLVGILRIATNLRNSEEKASKLFMTTAAFLGVSNTSIIKGKLKFDIKTVLGGYSYFRGDTHSNNVKEINSIKDLYDDIGGYKGVYYIHTTTSQSNYVTGGYNFTNQLDTYDISTNRYLGGFKNYY